MSRRLRHRVVLSIVVAKLASQPLFCAPTLLRHSSFFSVLFLVGSNCQTHRATKKQTLTVLYCRTSNAFNVREVSESWNEERD